MYGALYAHMYASYEVTGTNQAIENTVHLFDTYTLTNMTTTFQI